MIEEAVEAAISRPEEAGKLAEEVVEAAVSRAEEAGKKAGRKIETRLEFLARMYAANKAKQTEEEDEEAKKVKQAKIKGKTEDE
ncbi:hypothetical protein ES703_101193 [subsurface metagenome]